MRVLGWSLRLIGPLLLIGVLIKVDFRQVLPILARVEVGHYAAGLAFTWLIVALRTWRWHEINREFGIRLTFRYELGLYHIAFALGALTPARAGEFVKVYYIGKRGFPASRAFGSILLDRMSDVIWILALGLPSVAVLLDEAGASWPMGHWVVFLLAVPGLAAGVWAVWKWRGNRRGRGEDPMQWEGRVISWFREIRKILWGMRAGFLARIALWTAVSWMVQYFQCYLFSKAIGLDIALWDLAVMTNVIGIVSLLPITVAGVGSRDVTLVYYFAKLGLGAPEAIAYSTTLLSAVLGYVLVAVVTLMCWREGPRRFRLNRNAPIH